MARQTTWDRRALDELLTGMVQKPLTWWRTIAAFGVLVLLAVGLLVLSPLLVALLNFDLQVRSIASVKEWSEIVNNTIESLAIMLGALVLVKWIASRQDRATDVLLELETRFKELVAGKLVIEDHEGSDTTFPSGKRHRDLDNLLRFYVILYGVHLSGQVPRRPLSICFRYWIAHYYRRDRQWLRAYVDEYYPTLKHWLDTERESFFRPDQLFKPADLIETI